jgi:hypothetical protein
MQMCWLITRANYFLIREKQSALLRLLVLGQGGLDRMATTPWEAPLNMRVAVQEQELSGLLRMLPADIYVINIVELESQGFVCLLTSKL